MSTGSGKSAIYQLAGLPHRRPDRRRLAAHRAPAGPDGGRRGARPRSLNSTLTERQREEVIEDVADDDVEFVLLAPEQLANEEVLARARRRPASVALRRRRGALRQRSGATTSAPTTCGSAPAIEALGHPPVLALTATAAPPVRDEIVERARRCATPRSSSAASTARTSASRSTRHEEADRKRRALLDRVEARRGRRHRLLRDEEGRRGGRRRAARARRAGRALPRRPDARGAARSARSRSWTPATAST